MLLALLLSAALAADCEQTWSARDVASSAAYASGSFAAMDADSFARATHDLDQRLPCVGEVLTPTDVADIHGVHALSAFLAHDEDLARRSLAAALVALPSYDLSTSIAPQGHPLRDLLDQARHMEPAPPMDLTPPDQAVLFIDGARSLQRASDRPVVAQLVHTDGSLAFSGWFPASEPLPAYPEGSLEDALALMGEAPPDHTSSRILAGVGAAALVGSGVLYGLSYTTRARFDDLDTPYEELESLRARNNSYVVASGVSGVLGLGLGAAAVFTW